MTTLAAIYCGDKGSFIGSDSRLTNGGGQKTYLAGNQNKIILHNEWALGMSGSFKVMNLVDRHRKAIFDDMSDAHEFPDILMGFLQEAGYTVKGDDQPGFPTYAFELILASPYGVWEIDNELAISETAENNLVSVGSGAVYALGSAHSTQSEKNPTKRIVAAISAASHYDVCTGGEIKVCHMKPK